jgi:hypothetical protein
MFQKRMAYETFLMRISLCQKRAFMAHLTQDIANFRICLERKILYAQ